MLERVDAGQGLWGQGPVGGLFDLWFSTFERLTRKKMALGCVGEEEVGSESGGVTQERADEEVVGPVSKGEEAGEEG